MVYPRRPHIFVNEPPEIAWFRLEPIGHFHRLELTSLRRLLRILFEIPAQLAGHFGDIKVMQTLR
eukprot:SAG25_NODE_12080_length_288_cov_0.862434_1_plen_64_part_01